MLLKIIDTVTSNWGRGRSGGVCRRHGNVTARRAARAHIHIASRRGGTRAPARRAGATGQGSGHGISKSANNRPHERRERGTDGTSPARRPAAKAQPQAGAGHAGHAASNMHRRIYGGVVRCTNARQVGHACAVASHLRAQPAWKACPHPSVATSWPRSLLSRQMLHTSANGRSRICSQRTGCPVGGDAQ